MASGVSDINALREAFDASLAAPLNIIRNTTWQKIYTVARQLKNFNFTKDDINRVAEFYRDFQGKTGYIKKTSVGIPMSVVYLDEKMIQPESKITRPGLYLLLKSKLEKKPVAQGTHSRITWAYHWESEKLHVFRSLLYKHLGRYEILLNRELSYYPQCFATGIIISYASTWSDRSLTLDELATNRKSGMKNHYFFQKAGSILPYYKNGNLREWLAKIKSGEASPLTELSIIQSALIIAAGLRQMHQMGFVHLDVKMENILIDDEGNPKITDMGLAETTLPAPVSGSRGSTSPQRILAEITKKPVEVTFADDVWSFGCIIPLLYDKWDWYNWSQHHHHTRLLEKEVVQKKIEELFPGQQFPNILIRKCLEFDPTKRATMMEVAALLEAEEIRLTTSPE